MPTSSFFMSMFSYAIIVRNEKNKHFSPRFIRGGARKEVDLAGRPFICAESVKFNFEDFLARRVERRGAAGKIDSRFERGRPLMIELMETN